MALQGIDLFKTAKKVRDELRDNHKEYNCSYGIVLEDGTNVQVSNRVCFLSVKYSFIDNIKNKEIKYFITVSLENKLRDCDIKYLKWLTTQSCFNKAFITKKPETILEKGAILNVDYPPQYIISAAIAIRYCREYPIIPYSWEKYSKYINPHVAFMLAHFNYDKKGKNRLYFRKDCVNSHHGIFNNFSKEKLLKIVNRDFSEFKEIKNFSINTDYTELELIWGEGDTVLEFPNLIGGKEIDTWGDTYYSYCINLKDVEKTAKEFEKLNLEV